VPWSALCVLIDPFYPKPGNGRPPVGVERMLRVYFLHNGSICRTRRWRRRCTIRRRCAALSASTSAASRFPTRPRCAASATCLRRTIWAGNCSRRCSGTWRPKGLKVATGTIVDATITDAPSSTKNAAKARDPEMHQTKKGNQWYFGMKAHFGVDSRTKLIHSVAATPANPGERPACGATRLTVASGQ
jgi:IS5 family transposase